MQLRDLRIRIQAALGGFLPAEEAAAEAWLWLEEGLGQDRASVLGQEAGDLPIAELERVEGWLARRRLGEPWAYIHGSVEWRGRRFRVTRDILIPRPETELLLEAALEVGRRLQVRHACDIGTGSGILGISMALETDWEVTATDIEPGALNIARQNAETLQALVHFAQGSLLAALPDPLGLIVSNPPYVDPAERPTLQPELAWEPEGALFALDRGLGVATELLRQAKQRRAPGALLEIGAGQGSELQARAGRMGWRKILIHKDFAGHDRVLVVLP